MRLPDFILAGAPKAGTSSLWHYLGQHPDIFMSPVKEIFYFDFNYECGVDWYARHFEEARADQIVGEATVWYMRWTTVPPRVHEELPNVKLLFVLRNPVERAYSNWAHEKRDGIHPFDETFDSFLERPDRDNRTILSAGYYDIHLERWLNHFNEKKIHVEFYDDMRLDPISFMSRIFNFLEVTDISAHIDFSLKDNVSWWYTPVWPLRLGSRLAWPIRRTVGIDPVRLAWRKSRHFRRIFHNKAARPPAISLQARQALCEHYRPHNERLEEILGRPLPDWS